MERYNLGSARRSAVMCTIVAGWIATWCVAASCAEEPAATFTLRYQFQPGDSVYYTVDNQSQIEVEQAEAEQEVEHSEITHKHYRVVSLDEEGNGVLELMIDRVQMSAAVDGGDPVTYDSQADAQPPAEFIGISGTIGKPHARVKISPTGELLDIEWLVEGPKEKLPTKEDAGTLDILAILPAEPVAVGGEWNQRFEAEAVVDQTLRKKMTLLRMYKLTSVDGGRAKIDVRTSIITPLRDPAVEAQLIQKTASGTIEFDLERGLLASRATKLDREVVGFNGGKSRIRNRTTRVEQMVDGADVAAGPAARQTAQEPGPEAK